MRKLIVNVHKASFDIRQDLNLILQLLANIVCLGEGGIFVHHDVDLHEIVWAALRAYPCQFGECVGWMVLRT